MSGAGSITDETKAETRIAVIVNNDTDTAIAMIERASIEITMNEENAEFAEHTNTRVTVDPTTEQPELSFTGARSLSTSGDGALDELGVRDDANSGEYVRDAAREWGRMDLWYYDNDADITSDDPTHEDRFNTVRWDLDSYTVDENGVMFDATAHVEGTINLNWEA